MTHEEQLREALQAGTIRYSRDHGEPDPSPAFPVEVVFTMPQWEAIINIIPCSSGSMTAADTMKALEAQGMKLVVALPAEQPSTVLSAAGTQLADEILRRIALRYKDCEVHIFPDLPELTPVEAVLRCAKEEGFVLASAQPTSTGTTSVDKRAQELIDANPGSSLSAAYRAVALEFAAAQPPS